MTTKRLSAAESPMFHEQAKELGRICEQLRPGTGDAIEHFMRMAFDEGVASAQARWITVSERLPEEVENGFRWVQVWDKYWNTTYFATWTGEDWEPVSERAPEHEITHWQPLPDAPEGDQG